MNTVLFFLPTAAAIGGLGTFTYCVTRPTITKQAWIGAGISALIVVIAACIMAFQRSFE